MSSISELIDQQSIRAFATQENDGVILSITSYPLGASTVLTAEQAIDLATELVATANRIQMKEAA